MSELVPAGLLSSTIFRRILTLALALSLAVSPAPALAQDGSFLGGNRKWLYGILGASLTAIPTYLISDPSSSGENCTDRVCVTIIAGAIGGAIGFLIGSEVDSKYKRRMAAGPSLTYEYMNVPLGLVPDRLTGFPGGAAVSGLGGARVVMRDGTVWNRAFGVRGIQDLAVLSRTDLLILSTTSNLLAFPVRGDSAQGELVDSRGGGSMGVFNHNLAVAGLDSLRLLELKVAGNEVAVETLTGLESLDYVTDIAFNSFGGTGWVLMGDRLVSYTSDLRRVGELVLPSAGRTVRAQGSRLVVAAGTEGVYLLDITDPASPKVVQQFTGVRFAYAADLGSDYMYVAAGPEGMVVVDLRGAELKVIGVARKVQFASDILVNSDNEVWILDRDGRQVQIADINLGAANGDASSSASSR